jgi:hypothetical protein
VALGLCGTGPAGVHNTSDQPVYDVAISWPAAWTPSKGEHQLGAILPGTVAEARRELSASVSR